MVERRSFPPKEPWGNVETRDLGPRVETRDLASLQAQAPGERADAERGQVDRRALFQELWLDGLELAGEGSLHTTGGCMLPTLAPGDRVLVERLPIDRYRVGDVIVYQGEESLVAHRLVGAFRTAGGVRMVHKGDNSAVRGVLPARDILGRVVAVVSADGARAPVDTCPPPTLHRLYYSTVAAIRHLARRIKLRLRMR